MLKYEGLFKRRQNMGEWLYNTFVEGIIPTYIYFFLFTSIRVTQSFVATLRVISLTPKMRKFDEGQTTFRKLNQTQTIFPITLQYVHL